MNNNSFSHYSFFKFKDSSVLHSAAWAHDQEVLIIVFNSGSVWLYHDATEDVYKNLINAQSPGKYFNLNIRNTLTGNVIYKKGSELVQEA